MLFQLFIFSGILCLTSANVIPSTKIVGGTETDIKNYPWQVSVVRAITGQHYCGGAIVGRATILTAANCIHLSEREILTDGDIRVRIGSTSRTNGRNLRTILRILVHRQFNGSTLQNNIAILTLTNFLDFTESIRSVSLPAINVQLETDEIVILTGYGEKWTREFAENLEAVQLQVVEQSVCKVAYEQSVMPAITDNMFCAGSAGNGLCEGDIGGPLVKLANANTTLYGLASFSNGCGRHRFPSVFVRVSNYIEWIEDNLH